MADKNTKTVSDLISDIQKKAQTSEVKSFSPWERSKKKIVFILIIVGILLGYILFFFSPLLVQKTAKDYDITVTPLNTDISDENNNSGRTIQIKSWVYSPAEQAMEVRLSVSSTTFDGIDHYKWNTNCAPENKKIQPRVTPLLEDPDYIVLRIDNVPEKWDFLVVRMFMPNAKTDSDNALVKLYCGSSSIKQVKHIPVKTGNEYRADRVQLQINSVKKSRAKEVKALDKNYEQLKGYDRSEKQVRDSLQNATPEQRAEYEDNVAQIQEQRAETKENIKSHKSNIKAYDKEIKNLEKVRDSYLKEVKK